MYLLICNCHPRWHFNNPPPCHFVSFYVSAPPVLLPFTVSSGGRSRSSIFSAEAICGRTSLPGTHCQAHSQPALTENASVISSWTAARLQPPPRILQYMSLWISAFSLLRLNPAWNECSGTRFKSEDETSCQNMRLQKLVSDGRMCHKGLRRCLRPMAPFF